MGTNYQLQSDDLKDFFYMFGIFSTCIMSFLSILITLKNRRNTLRESLYKEQLIFSNSLINEFYKLHSILTRLNHNQKIELSELMLQVETIFGIIFSHSHIGSNRILSETSITLDRVNNIIDNLKREESITLNYEKYVNNYQKLISTIREELGFFSLSKENEKLIKRFF
ncbi:MULTISPECIES: hypothetical protein [Flavobacterium]|uniref:hypothetical protein n=1 Tax=Flavobacterium TaxID=237 RepID=UPI000272EED0|nr:MULTISPECIES: hypothetical protein [Flavobacterium]EJG03312.1 hypothetical protein FF52_01345 [Flavobacterium sp. F52]URM38982.1 hypothetical protein LLY39_10845 [Flavobacterium anhuiense]